MSSARSASATSKTPTFCHILEHCASWRCAAVVTTSGALGWQIAQHAVAMQRSEGLASPSWLTDAVSIGTKTAFLWSFSSTTGRPPMMAVTDRTSYEASAARVASNTAVSHTARCGAPRPPVVILDAPRAREKLLAGGGHHDDGTSRPAARHRRVLSECRVDHDFRDLQVGHSSQSATPRFPPAGHLRNRDPVDYYY